MDIRPVSSQQRTLSYVLKTVHHMNLCLLLNIETKKAIGLPANKNTKYPAKFKFHIENKILVEVYPPSLANVEPLVFCSATLEGRILDT